MIYAIFSVIGAILTLILHEASHVIAAYLQGHKITAFMPYPHFSNETFYFGRMSYRITHDQSKMEQIFVLIAPAVKSLTLLILWSILGFLVYKPLLILAAWELIDQAWWWIGWINHSDVRDGGRVRELIRT